MSVSRPARCLFTVASVPHPRPRSQCRYFSSSICLSTRRRPRFANVKASDMGLVSNASNQNSSGNFDMEAKAKMAERYTPEQLRVIDEAEKAIEIDDINSHGVIRSDPYGLPYLDDLRTIAPVIDKRFKEPGTIPPDARWMSDAEGKADMLKRLFEKSLKYQETRKKSPAGKENPELMEEEEGQMAIRRIDILKYLEEATLHTGGGSRGSPSLAPSLPKAWDGEVQAKTEVHPRDPEGKYNVFTKQTGLSMSNILNLKIKTLAVNYVSNQTRMGKIPKVYVIVCAGNGNGLLGIGEGKAAEPADAILKARKAAIRAMKPIPRYEDRTIYGQVEAKFGATKVQLMSRPPGFGLRCQQYIFEMARCAGIHDLAARVPRARNKMNTVKATYEALMSQRIPEEIARGRGKKLVDVRKVYYGGSQMWDWSETAGIQEKEPSRF